MNYIITNYIYVNNLDSNYLNSLSNNDFRTYIRDINSSLLENNFHFCLEQFHCYLGFLQN